MYKIADSETAKDIVQDTFLAVVKNMDKFNNESNPKTWIFSILNNKITDYYRKKYREPITTDIDSSSTFFNENGDWITEKQPKDWPGSESNLLDDAAFRHIMNKCIENLPAKWNALVKMKFLDEKETSTICQELEISTTNMWQIMHRAKLKLRECLEINWFKN
jgi:RNA polymerase sigma-70 factor (ECF subfamily)